MKHIIDMTIQEVVDVALEEVGVKIEFDPETKWYTFVVADDYGGPIISGGINKSRIYYWALQELANRACNKRSLISPN